MEYIYEFILSVNVASSFVAAVIIYKILKIIMGEIMMLNRRSKDDNIFHKSFKIGIFMKGIDGILEIIGGMLLMFLNSNRMNKLIVLLTQHELIEDPKDVIANFIIRFGSKFSVGAQYFAVVYLISHGVIKLILVILLWQEKLWAYPLSVVSLILFSFYQVYRYTNTHSESLILLTIFDSVMIVLTLIEYRRIKLKIQI